MAADSHRSEQIEACLVDLARRHYGAHLIENNDLTDDELWDAFQRPARTINKRWAPKAILKRWERLKPPKVYHLLPSGMFKRLEHRI